MFFQKYHCHYYRNKEIEYQRDPLLSFAELDHEHVDIQFPYFDNNGNGIFERTIPVKKITLENGEEKYITTVFDSLHPLLSWIYLQYRWHFVQTHGQLV